MSNHRSFARTALALAASLAALAASALAPGGAVNAREDVDHAPAQTAAIVTTRYCYNWDFLNNTGQDVNDLHVDLKGLRSVTEVYTGTLNPFGPPGPGSGYDPAADVYRLDFAGATVLDGDVVHLGLCTPHPVLQIGSPAATPPFFWTQDGARVQPEPLFVNLAWKWQGRSRVQFVLGNTGDMTMTLQALNLLDAGQQIELEDLNAPAVAQLPMVGNLAPDPMLLPPRATSFFDGFAVSATNAQHSQHASLLEANHSYVLEAILTAEGDEGNVVHIYSQALSPSDGALLPLVHR